MHTTTSTSSDIHCPAQPATGGFIRLKPISALICDDSNTISSNFAFDDNSTQDAQKQILEEPQPIKTPTQLSSPPSSTQVKQETTEDDVPERNTQLDRKSDTKSVTTPRKTKPDLVFATPSTVNRKFRKKLTGNYHKLTDFFTPTSSTKTNQSAIINSSSSSGKENIGFNKRELNLISENDKDRPDNKSPPEQVVEQRTTSSSSVVMRLFNDECTIKPVTILSVTKKAKPTTINNRLRELPKMTKYDHENSCLSPSFPVRLNLGVNLNEIIRLLCSNWPGQLNLTEEENNCIHISLTDETMSLIDQRSLWNTIEAFLKQYFDVSYLDDVISLTSSLSDQEDIQFVPETTAVTVKSQKSVKNKSQKKTSKAKKPAKVKSPPKTPKKRTTGRKITCPSYKLINGTSFAVDAFRFGEIPGITHYFLTHFHSDHYVGLKKDFAHPIYMSTVTANLVRAVIKVDEKYICPIELQETIVVDSIEITALDANQ